MTKKNQIQLWCDDRMVREIDLDTASLEIGSCPDADVHIDDSAVAPRAFLIHPRDGTVWLIPVAEPKPRPRVLPLDVAVSLGGAYTLVRRSVRTRGGVAKTGEASTVRLLRPAASTRRWVLVVMERATRRRVPLSGVVAVVGSGPECDVVVADPTVSARHVRFEVLGPSLIVRDLGSTNGTFLRGAEIRAARVAGGALLRIGCTDLQIETGPEEGEPEGSLIAASPCMRGLLAEARRAAELMDRPLLLVGPSGAGKEGIARFVHEQSARARRPFVSENAAAIPRLLVESHLFGHERGAFTGASAGHRGLFEQAHGGTLLLDEIGELPLELQARLLRVLETWRVRRLGAERDVAVDVRLICATHRDLRQMVREGSFREDLYFRLARTVLCVPGLDERQEDILPLAEHFLAALGPQLGIRSLSPAALGKLLAHHWAGNVRELRNVVEQAAFMCPGPLLELADVEAALERVSGTLRTPADASTILRTLDHCGGNMTEAARILATPRTTLRDRLRKALG